MGTYNVLRVIFNEDELEVDFKISVDKVAQILATGIIQTSSFNEDDSEEVKEYKIEKKFYKIDDDSMNFVIE